MLRLWDDADTFTTSVDAAPRIGAHLLRRAPLPHRQPPHSGRLLAGVLDGRSPLLDDTAAIGWCVASAGTRTACPSRWKCSKLGLSGPVEIEAFGVKRSTRGPGRGWAANTESWQAYSTAHGAAVGTTTRPWTSLSWSRCGGSSAASGPGLIYHDFKVLPYSLRGGHPCRTSKRTSTTRRQRPVPLTVRLDRRRPRPGAGRGLPAHLDHHPLDFAGQPRRRRGGRPALRAQSTPRWVGTTAATRMADAPTGPTTTCIHGGAATARDRRHLVPPAARPFPDRRTGSLRGHRQRRRQHRRRHPPCVRPTARPTSSPCRHLRFGGPGRRRGALPPPSEVAGLRVKKPTPCCSGCSISGAPWCRAAASCTPIPSAGAPAPR